MVVVGPYASRRPAGTHGADPGFQKRIAQPHAAGLRSDDEGAQETDLAVALEADGAHDATGAFGHQQDLAVVQPVQGQGGPGKPRAHGRQVKRSGGARQGWGRWGRHHADLPFPRRFQLRPAADAGSFSSFRGL